VLPELLCRASHNQHAAINQRYINPAVAIPGGQAGESYLSAVEREIVLLPANLSAESGYSFYTSYISFTFP
jgi:hypothetical protein